MTTPNSTSVAARRHPMMIAAAIAVILFCAVGTAAILGWLPSSRGVNRAPSNPAVDPSVTAAAPFAGQPPVAVLPTRSARPVAGASLPGQPVTVATLPAAAPVDADGDGGNGGSTRSGEGVPAAIGPTDAAARTARIDDTHSGARWCAACGNVESVHETTTRARGTGMGAGAGAILGGLLGNQIGHGNGRSLATVAGAVGGAVMGNRVEGTLHSDHSYEIRVRLDDGTLRTFYQHNAPPWRMGDRVRIVKGALRTA